jgi:hypothetical protein
VWAVDAAVEELRPGATERAERRTAEGSFLARQLSFDGGMRIYGELDPLGAATVNAALDARAAQPADDGAGDQGVEPAGTAQGHGSIDTGLRAGRWTSTSKARQDARALVDVCAEWLGGDPDRRRRARPLLVAHVDLSQATAHPCGTIELGVRGPLPRIGAATLEALARDADVKAVLFDGARPLAVTRKRRAKVLPDDVRFAVGARDRGCRFPGSQDPLGHSDRHHIDHRSRGGDHHPDRVVGVSRRWHTVTHRHGWSMSLEPATGKLTIRRGGRTYHSLPRGTLLSRPPPATPDDDPPDPTLPF